MTKLLRETIQQAHNQWQENEAVANLNGEPADYIIPAVKDFAAQLFTIAMLEADQMGKPNESKRLKRLFERVFGATVASK